MKTLIYTSVDDMKSTLRCARRQGGIGRDTLTMARDLAESLGARTKVKLLEAELRWLDRRTGGR